MSTMKKKESLPKETGIIIRLFFVFFVLAGLGFFIGIRSFQLQIANSQALKYLAEQQYVRNHEFQAKRGKIVDRNFHDLAISNATESVYIHPHLISAEQKPLAVKELSAALHLPEMVIESTIKKAKYFAWIKREVSPEEARSIRQMQYPFAGVAKESKRMYPQKELAAQLLGFTGTEPRGLEGIEKAYDDVLQGQIVSNQNFTDGLGKKLFTDGVIPTIELEGRDIVLTIDSYIQHVSEKAIKETVDTFSAKRGSAIVIDPQTGEVLAMANYPSFDPNQYKSYHKSSYRNGVISDQYEPGSTFKSFLMAAALEEKVIHSSQMIFCENGSYQVGRHIIHDTHKQGWLDMQGVLVHSSNICAAKIGALVGKKKLQEYVAKFNFGKKTYIGLDAEAGGKVPKRKKWPDITLATISFGQGIATTPLQIAAAYNVLANGGVYKTPKIIKAFSTQLGEILPFENTASHRVVSQKTAEIVTEMLEKVVTEGTGKKAAIPSIRVAGKTGTAQKPDPVTRGYSSSLYISSFVGYAPLPNPRLVVLVSIDEPKNSIYGGDVAAPTFAKIMEESLRYLGVGVKQALVLKTQQNPVQDNILLVDQLSTKTEESNFFTKTSTLMINLIGLDMHTAIEKANQLGMKAHISGSGLVSHQSILPGSPISKGQVCMLQFQSHN